MRMKAKAYQQYGDEAVMALVLESLPSIAKQVAKPLEKVKKIVKKIVKNFVKKILKKIVKKSCPLFGL